MIQGVPFNANVFRPTFDLGNQNLAFKAGPTPSHSQPTPSRAQYTPNIAGRAVNALASALTSTYQPPVYGPFGLTPVPNVAAGAPAGMYIPHLYSLPVTGAHGGL